jgi:hypothetical protein
MDNLKYNGPILGFGTNMKEFAMCTINVEGFINIDKGQPSSDKFAKADLTSKMANALKNVQRLHGEGQKLADGRYMVGKYYVSKVSKHFSCKCVWSSCTSFVRITCVGVMFAVVGEVVPAAVGAILSAAIQYCHLQLWAEYGLLHFVQYCLLQLGKCSWGSTAAIGEVWGSIVSCSWRGSIAELGKYRTGPISFTLLNVYAGRFVKALKYKIYWHKVLEPLKS